MNNLLKKTICVLLSVIFCSAVFTSCKKKPDSGSESNSETPKENTNHIFNYTETDRFILENGATEYKIVMAENVTTELGYAKKELVNLFKEATGVTLETVSGANLSHSASGKYFSLGKTKLYETSGLNVDLSALKSDAARIITKDNTVYFLGGSDSGVLYAVYDFLNLTLNFEAYAKTCYTLDKNVKNIKLMNYDVTDIPDIDYRCRGVTGTLYASSSEYNDEMYSYRLRTVDIYANHSLPIHEGWTQSSKSNVNHNCFTYLPTAEYLADHPKFYSSRNPEGQLCYTARGDKDEYDLMITYCAQKIEQSLTFYPREQFPLYTSVQFGIADNYDMCACDECKRVMDKHNGAIVATIIPFLKDVARKVNAWMELPENADYKRENFQYMFFAYYDTLEAPFAYDESTGKYVAADNSVLPEEVNITPFFALNKMDHAISIYDENNAAMRETLDSWLTYYKDAWGWIYGCFYQDYFAFYDCYNYYADACRYYYERDFKLLFPQLHSMQRGADTGFFTMAAYVFAKLSWNSSLDITELMDNFMNAMFKDAAEPMKKVLTEGRLWHARSRYEGNWNWTAWWKTPTMTAGFFKFGYVHKLFDIFDEAYAAIEKYKSSPAVYAELKNRIDIEWLYPAKIAISHFRKEISVDEYNEICAKFKQICLDNSITRISETELINDLLQSL